MLAAFDMAEATEWKARLKELGIRRARKAAPAPRRGDDPRRALGLAGEETAARLLAEGGLRIVDRNVRYPNGELDLVAETDRLVVFVEVKRRTDAARGTAAESVTPLKRSRVLRAARRWLGDHPESRGREVRFDVVAIQDEPFSIDWIRGAFDAS